MSYCLVFPSEASGEIQEIRLDGPEPAVLFLCFQCGTSLRHMVLVSSHFIRMLHIWLPHNKKNVLLTYLQYSLPMPTGSVTNGVHFASLFLPLLLSLSSSGFLTSFLFDCETLG